MGFCDLSMLFGTVFVFCFFLFFPVTSCGLPHPAHLEWPWEERFLTFS